MKLTQELLSTKKTDVTEARGIYEPVTDADINRDNDTLIKRGGVLRKGNGGAMQVVTDGDKTLRQSLRKKSVTEASEMDDANRRNAEHLEVGDPVEITGDVSFKGETGEITHFGKDKRFVVVKLHNGGEHSFHSSDVSEVERDFDEEEGEDNEDHNKFYVAFYDSDEERSWIGLVSKEHGGKWHEKTFKGKPEYRWGQTYMSYLSPEDIMRWIHKDYGRSVEIEGPFYDPEEAMDHVKQNWGKLEESAVPKRGADGMYGVKVGQIYVPADGSKNELKVIAVDKDREEVTVFDKVQGKERDIDAYKLAVVRYCLKEELEESVNTESACYKANRVLTSAYRKMLGDKTLADKVKKEMTAAYKMLRDPLEDDDVPAFKKAWEDAFLQHPDGFDALMDQIYDEKVIDYDSFKKHFKLTESHDEDDEYDHSGRYVTQQHDGNYARVIVKRTGPQQYEVTWPDKSKSKEHQRAVEKMIRNGKIMQDMETRESLEESYGADMRRDANRLKRAGDMVGYHKKMERYCEYMADAMDFNARQAGRITATGRSYLNQAKKFMKKADEHRNGWKNPEASETVEESFKPGDMVHIGMGTKGGAGYRGKLLKIDDDEMAHVELPTEGKFGKRVVKGHVSKLSADEVREAKQNPDKGGFLKNGSMVRVTNPKAPARYKIADDGHTATHYKIIKPSGEEMMMSKERIARVNRAAKELDAAKAEEPKAVAEESLTEGLRLLKTYTNGRAMAKVYKDSEWGEYQVKMFKNGEHTSNHHTEDLDDANGVAEIWTKKNAKVTEDFTKTHKLVSKITGEEIKVGQVVKNFRGEKMKVMGWWPGRHPGSTGRVETDKGAYYPSVIDAEVVPIVEPYVKKVEEANERTEWGISEKGAGDYNEAGEWVHRAPTWYKTRNERHQHAQRLKKQGKDFNTHERTVKGVAENTDAWAALNDAARALGAESFSRLPAIDAAGLVNFRAANEVTETMFGSLNEGKSLMGKTIRISNPKHNMSGHKGKVVWCNDDGTECEMEYVDARGKKDKCSVSTKDITVESVKRFWTLSSAQMKQVIESHPELLIGSALDALNESTEQTPWDVLTKLAQRHGVEYFSQLTPAVMDKYINYKSASDHAAKDFGKHAFEKLDWQQMMHIMNKHPEYMRDEAKAIYAPEPVEEELKIGSFTLSPADEKDIPFLNKLTKNRAAAKREKEAEERRNLIRKMSEPSNTKNEPEAGHRKGAEARISLIRDLSTPKNA